MRHLLRVGLGIMFIWIGVMIEKNPVYWLGFLKPWAFALLPDPLHVMMGTGLLDIALGIFFLADVYLWIAALIASIHLIVILITCGVDEVTVRDIGLLGGTLALFWNDIPGSLKLKLRKLRRPPRI